MRIRRLLLVHPNRSIRALIKKYIFAELADIEIIEAETGRQALGRIDTKGFDVILATDHLKDMDVSDFKSGQESTASNGHTPLIVISESESLQARNTLAQKGFDRVVQLRVRPAELIQKINSVCNPRHWRKDARYHIPNAGVLIVSAHGSLEASLINFSLGGVLVELRTESPERLLRDGLSLTLYFPMEGKRTTIDNLAGRLLRLDVTAWRSDHVPQAMRATFIFEEMPPGSRSRLNEMVQMATKERLVVTELRN